MEKNFDCLFVALVTPYKPGSFDLDDDALRRLLRYFLQPKFVDAGGAIIINPEAGEIFYLTREEKRRNVEIAVEECRGKMPVFAGAIAPTTRESVDVALDAKTAGVDGIFLMPPVGANDVTGYWNPERYPEIWVDMAKEICNAVNLPAIVHPSVSAPTAAFGHGLPLSVTLKMCNEVPQIIGWKLIYPYNAYRVISRGLRQLPRHVGVLPASAWLFHESFLTGQIDGTVTGSFNYAMEPMIDHIQAWRRNDVDEARRIWDSGLAELHYYVYADIARLHIRYKVACWLRGLIPHPFMRPPLPKPKAEEVHTLRALLQGAGLSVIEDAAEDIICPSRAAL